MTWTVSNDCLSPTPSARQHIFFTVALAERSRTIFVDNIDLLRESIRQVKSVHPFQIVAMVVLPDHLHSIWTLPSDDCDYSTRWRQIKSGFSRALPPSEHISASRKAKQERGIWQRRFWEHTVRDEADLSRCADYIHFNPVKHGLANKVSAWPYSTFHRFVEQGMYSVDWAGDASVTGSEFDGYDGFR